MALTFKAVLIAVALSVPLQALAQGVTVPPDARIAFVSMQRISSESAAGKAALGRVTTFQQQKAGEIRVKQATLVGIQQQLDRATLPEERAKLSAQVATERTELERMAAQAQAELQNLQREVNNEIRPKLAAVLAELVKGTKIEVVTNADATVIWGSSALDLTNAVIERLNATASATSPVGPATGAAKPPAPPSDKVTVPTAPSATPAKPGASGPSGSR